jgi:uncharacterized protein YbjT (DUF2867 family)
MRTAVIAGATGLVGSELLLQLLDDPRYARVIALVRRASPLAHSKLSMIMADFLHPEDALGDTRVDDVFCCLGTTMAKAGTREKFYEVDYQFPLALARATQALGASQFLLVSALGAKKTSAIFYNRVKGEVEEAINKLGFHTLHIFRPSLLLGPRLEKRAGEGAAKLLYKVFGPLVPMKYKGVEAGTVARAMRACASEERDGLFVHESDKIQGYR